MIDDATLLRRYTADREEEAFAEFVTRHLPLVYSAALRRLGGDAHRANDVAQVVFCTVARDARRLACHPELTGWLYTATRNAALDIIRSDQRRRVREQEAEIMDITATPDETNVDWTRLKPVLDAAMDELGDHDREAVLLRFFRGQPFAEIGRALGLSEDAARKRVDRALEKLRALLAQRRIASTAAALAALLSAETISAAPPQLAASVTGTALAIGSTTASAATTGLTFTKLHLTLAALVVASGAVGLATQQRTIATLRSEAATMAQRLAQEGDRAASPRSAPRSAPLVVGTPLGTLEGRGLDASSPSAPSANAVALTGPSTANPLRPAHARSHPSGKTGLTDPAAIARERARLHKRYDPFLQRHGLTPAQTERFVDLKMEIAEAQADLQLAMRQAGAQGGSPESEKLRSQLVGPLWQEINALLGPEGTKAYGAYESASFLHLSYIEPMLPDFETAKAALSMEQLEQLRQIFARKQRSTRANPSDIYTTNTMDWDAVVTDAVAILSPDQLAVLRTHANRRQSVSR